MISTPGLPRMRCNWATSASRGTLSRISVCSDSRPAIIKGNAAFFAPEIGMVPLSLLPPTIRIRSMPKPACLLCTKSIGQTTLRQKLENLRLFDGSGPSFRGRAEPESRDSGFDAAHRPGMTILDRVDVLALQHRLGVTIPRNPNHGPADLLGRGHVCRCHPIKQRQ